MRNSHFATWLGQLLAGLSLIGGGLHTAWLFWVSWQPVAFAGIGAAALGLFIVHRAESRARPRRLLRHAQRSLQLPKEWLVEFDKALPDGGEAPILVTRSDRARFVISVRNFKQAAVRKPIVGKDQDVLLGPNGKPFDPSKLSAVNQSASVLGAHPVLWLPKATEQRNLRLQSNGLLVVMGSARHLKHALMGAEVGIRQPAPAEPAPPPQVKSVKKAREAAEAALTD
jgi:hypothetical protein